MMTSSNGNIFRVIGHLYGEFTGHRGIPSQRSVTRSVDVFFDLRLNKRLSQKSRHRAHYDVTVWIGITSTGIGIGTWETNYMQQWDAIKHPCPNFNGGWKVSLERPFKLGYGKVITFDKIDGRDYLCKHHYQLLTYVPSEPFIWKRPKSPDRPDYAFVKILIRARRGNQ